MSNIADRLNRITHTLNSNQLTQVAYTAFVANTPIKTGNARRNTRIQGNSIKADYPYAQRLEDNYSPQTKGQGIVNPTLQALRDYVFNKTGIRIKI